MCRLNGGRGGGNGEGTRGNKGVGVLGLSDGVDVGSEGGRGSKPLSGSLGRHTRKLYD